MILSTLINNNVVLPNSNSITATFSPLTSDSCVLVTVKLICYDNEDFEFLIEYCIQ